LAEQEAFMDWTEAFMALGSIALILLLLRYARHPRRFSNEATTSEPAADIQHFRIMVKGGYGPNLVVVRVGRPVRLDFHRDESSACGARVVFHDFGIFRELPEFETTPIEFTPDRVGDFSFTCGMGMLRGTLRVEPDDDEETPTDPEKGKIVEESQVSLDSAR
jgi:P-type Cu+ transporter